ncbi:hypothetical protein [Geminocystis sp. GBBB08]|uniref:hypothetical protein n=1 Tax=Geminocystis sp. GBBB08 TaxID=2604140 RepID=UPI0027E2CD88|nr:hypothetical protein [Geminocystis sp. GBBB08]MBL1211473.1 hypothetical protein [Geminocystis sp. GBBB08]
MNESLNYIRQTIILIKYYSFDLRGYRIRELIVKWTKIYPHHLLPLAIIEAIYQGRLKAISVEQILNVWLKKREINQSFNEEFSRLINPNITLTAEEEQDIKYILTNCHNAQILPTNILLNYQQEKLDNTEILNSLELKMNNHNKNFIDDKIKMESSVNNFQPLDDYSQCFQKLKTFIISNDK